VETLPEEMAVTPQEEVETLPEEMAVTPQEEVETLQEEVVMMMQFKEMKGAILLWWW